jgi:hypothetical protein
MAETIFITTNIAHRNCEKCADCADSARIMARASGSVGATHNDGGHFATVRRGDQMHTLPVESADPYCAKHGVRFDESVGCPQCVAELPDMDESDLPRRFTVEFHNEAHVPTLRHRWVGSDETHMRWYLNQMVNWSEVKPGESIVIRREVV